MQVRHVKTLQQPQPGIARTHAVAWSANNKRLAVADFGRFVHLYDEAGERRDKFSTKPADPKGPKSFVIKDMAFSPDSVKLAIAQSDFIVFVYKLGTEWGERKSICNKFPQASAVTCMVWPQGSSGQELIVFGTQEGKVRVAFLSTNKSQTLYSHESPVVSIAASPDGNAIVSGHADGSIYRYIFESDDQGGAQGAQRIAQHSTVPNSVSWGETIAAAGPDAVVTFYDRNGHVLQNFDYPLAEERDITKIAFNPSGQTLAACSFNKIRLFNFNVRSRKWEEGNVAMMNNAYTITAMTWKIDGSRLITGTLCGAVDVFDACLKRFRVRGQFEFTYVSHNQVIVKRLSTGTRIVLKSHLGYEIQKVNVHKERYLVAHTATTLLIGDLGTCKLSEVPWHLSGREKYVFDNPQVCMVFAAGELSLIEYGRNEVLGTCRTDETNTHKMSVRIHEPPEGAGAGAPPARKAIAYLIDRQTIQVDDLISGIPAARISHQYKVDWLELNHRASKLLFRDKQHRLYLLDLATQEKVTLLNFCTYVQWVPESDVVVAQNRVDLCVWYSIETPDRVSVVPIKGEVEGIERSPGKTEVIVDEGVNTVAYGLEESLIEFGTAMDDHDYDKAADLLDQITLTPETEAMWLNLSKIALSEMKLYIAERCFAALGDVAKAHALNRINNFAADASKEANGATDGYDHYSVRAELYMLNKEFKRAEHVYLENGKPEKAMEFYDELYRFDESIAVAESRGHPDAANRRSKFFNWLMETGQEEKAGEVKEKEGKFVDAINLYLRGGVPAKAAHVVSAHNVKPEPQLLEAIASALFKAKIFERAGDFFEKLKMDERAIDAYKQGHVYMRAVDLANRVFPQYVVSLEDAWGDYLVAQKQVDQAINHYIQAHQYGKAINASITSRQWNKAVEILERHNVGDPNDDNVKGFYKQIAVHYEEAHQLADAEKYYIRAGAVSEAVDMYSRRGMSDQMYRVAQRHLSEDEIKKLFMDQAKQYEAKSDYASAERIFIKINRPDDAIVMYKKARDFTNMVRMVKAFRPEFVKKTYLNLANQMLKEENLKQAENFYVQGEDWSKAVAMYRERNMWEDAVRVAKVGGGANAAKQVVLSRALAIEPEEGVRLLIKFSMVDSGVEAALEAAKYDIALQWAQLALPGKLPYVYLKNAMHYEDVGDWSNAEENFVKAGKPREAIEMHVHQHDFNAARRIAENHDQSALSSINVAQARVCFQQQQHKEAEVLLLQANSPDLLLKFYLDANMLQDAQRIAREHVPEKASEVARRIAMNLNDPLQAAHLLEDNGEHMLAIEKYLSASRDNVNDPNQLVIAWQRAVKLCMTHARPQLRETLRIATGKMVEIGRAEDAGKCLEEAEDFKGAINVYVRGQKFELAEGLAERLGSQELKDYVKRARVEEAMKNNTESNRDLIESVDKEAALKAHVAANDWEKAMRLARQMGDEETKRYAAMQCRWLAGEGQLAKVLEVIARDGMDPTDFRFFSTWLEIAAAFVQMLPEPSLDLRAFHDGLVEIVEQMKKQAQPEDQIQRATNLRDVIHIYSTAELMKNAGFPDVAVKLMMGLPRFVGTVPADKVYYDVGTLAKDAGNDAVAFVMYGRFLDIVEKIEDDGEVDSSNIDNTEFAATDYPFNYPLPEASVISKDNYEEANKWVLAISIQQNISGGLNTVNCPQSGVEMWEGALRSPSGSQYEPCAITGYPVLDEAQRISCRACNRPANQDDWNRVIMTIKNCPWCGTPQSANFNM